MPPPERICDASRLADSAIRRHLGAAFVELDAATHDVETRKLLYALFVKIAIETAEDRFPNNRAMLATLEQGLAGLAPADRAGDHAGMPCKPI
jgi:hypothetical protein